MAAIIRGCVAASVLLVSLMFAPVPAVAREMPAVAPAIPCGGLRFFDPRIADYPMQVTDAREVEGQCRVQGYVSPQIHWEVRLPLKGWTQRYLQTGCGGLCGNLRIQAPQRDCPALQRGEFVTASTDMGHQGGGGQWGASDQQLRVDFGYRGVHATALVAKALIARFYGQAPRFSYFSGCSDGGREALMETQRYPGDFDGVAAGAPAMNFLVQNSLHHGWQARQVAPDGRHSVLTAADMPVLHAAAVGACDADDGVRDGLISDPFGCRFDPRVTECKPGRADRCLGHAAVVAAAAVYGGARDGEGRKLVVGGLMPGSELAWPGVAVAGSPPGPGAPTRAGAPPEFGGAGDPDATPADLPPFAGPGLPGSARFATDTIPWLAFPKPLGAGWTLADFRFDEGTLQSLRAMHGIYDASDPDLSRFAGHGGKLIMWHGLQDQHISPANTVAYAEAVADHLGATHAAAVLRTFLIPGMYHCGSGDGLTSIDVLTPLMAWVEDGQVPEMIVASRSDAEAAGGKGRPIFAWPALAKLLPGKDPDAPASWTRAGSMRVPPRLYADWLGAGFYDSGFQRDCGFDGEAWVCRPSR